MAEVIPVVDEGLGNSSYLVDLGDGSALVVDPNRDPTPYLDEAAQRGLRIRFTADTHLHADFISGSRDLAVEGAYILAPEGAALSFEHRGLRDGEEIDLGGLRLRAIATPGHTPEHLTYLLSDGPAVLALFTGGAVIVGSVARTDLISDHETEALTRAAYRSARTLLDAYPAELDVYPTHGAGSFCSVSGSSKRTTTIGAERDSNPVYGGDEDVFVTGFLQSLGTFPPYFLRSRATNQSGAPVGTHKRSMSPLAPLHVARAVADGAVVIDARPFEDFGRGHIPGSISVELRPQFASWLGWVATPDTRLVFVANENQDRADLMRQSLKIGFDAIEGEVAGGIEGWQVAGFDIAAIDLLDVPEHEGALIDVRQVAELAGGMIPGALNAEVGSIVDTPLPDGPLTLYCGHGQRGMTAASLLERDGRRGLNVLVGGPIEWADSSGERLEFPT